MIVIIIVKEDFEDTKRMIINWSRYGYERNKNSQTGDFFKEEEPDALARLPSSSLYRGCQQGVLSGCGTMASWETQML